MMKQILITGANRGIGLELARQCSQRGDRVYATCRRPEEAADLQALQVDSGSKLTILPLDVSQADSLAAIHDRIRASTAWLDYIFNNAGINLGNETIRNVRRQDMLQTLDVNAVSPIMVAQQFLDLLKAGREPRLINISSEAGSISQMNNGRGYSYFGSKAALNMYSRALAFDPEMYGIIVVALHPGWVRTDMGGSMAPLSADDAVRSILQLTDRLVEADSGKFLNYNGRELPW